jgi:hypothetical protein
MKKLLVIGFFGLLAGAPDEAKCQSTNNAYGDNQVEVEPGVFAIYSGDINQDGNIDIADGSLVEADVSNFAFGYVASDLNGDGNVDIADLPVMEANISNFIYAIIPTP